MPGGNREKRLTGGTLHKSRLRRSLLTALPALGLIATASAATALSASPASAITSPPAALTSISCTSATFCMAVGSATATMATQLAAERWDGAHWHRLPIAKPSGVTNLGPQAVACPSRTECVAVGSGTKDSRAKGTKGTGGTTAVLLAETWTPAKGWTASQPVQPGGTGYNALNTISCPTTSLCFAAGGAGEFASPAAQQLPLVERWNGSTWARVALGTPAGASDPFLSGISCPSAWRCAAVGDYLAGNTTEGLIERLSGGTWTASTAPGSTGGGLNGVSCPAKTACEAVGEAGPALLAERWTGARWVPSAPAKPANTTTPTLTGASCASAAHCVAIGLGFLPGSKIVAFTDMLSPAWTVTAQTGSGFGIAELSAVSCFSTAKHAPSCAVLGGTTAVTATQRPVSAFLTGTTWSIVPTM